MIPFSFKEVASWESTRIRAFQVEVETTIGKESLVGQLMNLALNQALRKAVAEREERWRVLSRPDHIEEGLVAKGMAMTMKELADDGLMGIGDRLENLYQQAVAREEKRDKDRRVQPVGGSGGNHAGR